MKMMATFRIIPRLRIPHAPQSVVTRSLICEKNTRFLCYEPKWRSHSQMWRNSNDCFRSRLLFHEMLLPHHQSGVLCQLHSNMAQKGKEEQSSASKAQSSEEVDDLDQFKKLSLYGKIKAMYRDYWYVLVPVHVASSVVFFGAFYYAASSGVDVIAILEKLHVSESLLSSLRDSSAGYIAIAYALYKIFTPVRYTVTLGGTTWAIRVLKQRGLIKPRPMKEAKENMQNIISAMKLPEEERQKFLEDKGMPRIGKAVSNLSNKSKQDK